MTSLTTHLSKITGEAFAQLGLDPALGAVRTSDRPDLAQFQCNGAMAAAKPLKKNPREIAAQIVETLQSSDIIESLDIAGPGFININLTDTFIGQHLQADQPESANNKDKTIIVDYGGMNVAKAMHVGHLRPTVIGDCIKRLLNHAGHNALGDIHLGDWGLQMGQIIHAFELENPEWPYFDPNFTGPYPTEAPFSYHELEDIYPKASQACKDDPKRLEAARRTTADLQAERPGYRALWEHFMTLSIADIRHNLAPLDVNFEIWKGEACVMPLVPEITTDLKSKNIIEDSEGAKIIRTECDDDKKEMPPLIFLKSNGAVTYGTTDLATIYDRINTHDNLSQIIYITDFRQNLHFEQLFRAANRAGYTDNLELTHIGNGTINGPDNKPFKTREGKAMRFEDMINSTIQKARERIDEANLSDDIDEQECEGIAKKVAIAALKFNELSNQPHVNYIFDLDRMTEFEGKTGPYILYQAVRIQSLLNKANTDTTTAPLQIDESSRPLALLLAEYPDHMDATLKSLSPHILCDYIYKLAQSFSSFYANTHIMSEEDEAKKASHLKLCTLTLERIKEILGILGIEIPKRM